MHPKYAEQYVRLATQWLTGLDAKGVDDYATNLKNQLQRSGKRSYEWEVSSDYPSNSVFLNHKISLQFRLNLGHLQT